METSDGGGIGVDCSVGTIVWVRRRNGSWWPGRILGHDELSESHLMSPRSGTPVKLLGREDASVDWYNLEKSKRVKSFRCGEFDACIERAEASQSIPIKKREKYARREDAILHALELEKMQKLGTTFDGANSKMIGTFKRESITLPSTNEPVAHGKLSSYSCEKIFKNVSFSHDEDDLEDYSHEGRSNQQFGHDNAEAIPRMRGLQDFGLRTAHSKRKNSLSSSWENSCKSIDDYVDSLSSPGHIIEGTDQASTSRTDVPVKRKRSYGGTIDELLLKKRDRRRPLMQVLQSSAKLLSQSFQPSCCVAGTSKAEEMEKMGSTWQAKRSRCTFLSSDLDDHFHHGGYNSEQMLAAKQFATCNDINYSENFGEGCNSSCLNEATDSDCCEGDLLEPNLAEEMDMLIDRDIILSGSKDLSPEIQELREFRSLIQEDTPISGFMSQLHQQAKDPSSKASVSKWSIKGKRNIRNVGKRHMDVGDAKPGSDPERLNDSINITYESKDNLKSARTETSSRRFPGHCFYPIKEEIEYSYNESDLIHKNLNKNHLIAYDTLRIPPVQSIGHHNRSHCGNLNSFDEDSHGINLSIWEPSNLACNPFWEEPEEIFDCAFANQPGNEMKPALVDVDLKVQTSYQGEHVPLVSLMSRLNGKAIIGHPIQIEILEDGSTGHLVFAHLLNKSTPPKAVWRTARRTAMHRVPRSILLSSAMEDEDAELFQYSGHGSKPSLHKKAYYHYLKHQVRQSKKRVSLHHSVRKFQRKNVKRAVSSSKKTRKLSSLASDEKMGGEDADHKLVARNEHQAGLIKAEDPAPLVTCIPLQVVFTRILEAVDKAHYIKINSPKT